MTAEEFESYFVATWTDNDAFGMAAMADFWYHVFVYTLLVRLHLIYRVCTDETFARQVFKAYSAKAVTQRCAGLASAESIEVA